MAQCGIEWQTAGSFVFIVTLDKILGEIGEGDEEENKRNKEREKKKGEREGKGRERKGKAKKRSNSDKAQLRSLSLAVNLHDALLGHH